MEEKEGFETVMAKIEIIPDHQLRNFEQLSEDSLRLFRISLVVLSIYGPVFGFLLQSGRYAVFKVLMDPVIIVSLFFFSIALGGFLVVYRTARSYCTNSLKSSEYLEWIEECPPVSEKNSNKGELIYEYYWKRATNYVDIARRLQTIVSIGKFSIFAAVIYAPLGLLSFYIPLPKWALSIVLIAVMSIPLILGRIFDPLLDGSDITTVTEDRLD